MIPPPPPDGPGNGVGPMPTGEAGGGMGLIPTGVIGDGVGPMVPGGTGPGVGFIVTGVTGVGMGLVPREGAGSEGLIPRDAAGAPGFKVTPARRISATVFPPAVPLIVSSTGLERVNAFLGMSVTVSFAGLNTAERSLSTGEFLATNDPLLFASANRKVATL